MISTIAVHNKLSDHNDNKRFLLFNKTKKADDESSAFY